MASIPEIIGKRPAKYTFGQGLGAALEGGGKYFGELAVQEKNAEALQAVRDYEEGRTKAAWDREDQQIAAATSRADMQRAQDIALENGRRAEDIAREDQRYAIEVEREDAQRAEEVALGNQTETVLVDGVPHKVRLDTNGNQVKDLGPDPDYAVDETGGLVKLSAGGKGAAPQKRTEAQIKYGIHERNLNSGLRVIEGVLGQGYDLESFQAFTDQVLSKFGDVGVWATSEQGKLYRTGVVRASEALFKGESGAAGSDNEAARYQSMFPSPSDSTRVQQLKFLMLEESRKAFSEASGLNRDDQVMYARSMADSVAAENGFAITENGFQRLQETEPAQRTSFLLPEDEQYMNSPTPGAR